MGRKEVAVLACRIEAKQHTRTGVVTEGERRKRDEVAVLLARWLFRTRWAGERRKHVEEAC